MSADNNILAKAEEVLRQWWGYESFRPVQGRHGKDLTKIISLNESALYLWQSVEGISFDVEHVASLLVEHYGIDADVAQRDAQRWVDKLAECGLIE